MSSQTQLAIRGLARDPSGLVAAGAGALRQARNVVIRSESVAEARPGLDLLFERTSTTARVRSMREFGSSLVTIESDDDLLDWTMSVDNGDVAAPIAGMYEPPNYNDAETQFASARGNLYLTGALGVFTLESPFATPRLAGVPTPPFATDYLAPELGGTAGSPGASYSYGYRFVMVRKDSNGYERRSPPSHPLTMTVGSHSAELGGVWASGTRMYLGYRCASLYAPGDVVEAYRSRTVAGLNPRPEYYLAWRCVLTLSDINNTYFVPPTDTTSDANLGAELYADQSVGGEISAKYPPPVARALAAWARCAWFGRVVEAPRLVVQMDRFGRAGVGSPFVPGHAAASYTSGSANVTVASTADLSAGMYWTDNIKQGSGVAGTFVPANTRIVSITDATHFAMSANALATGSILSGVVNPSAPRGIVAEKTVATYTNGSNVVTSVVDPTGVQVGMYWTDNAFGPLTGGSRVPIGTKVTAVNVGAGTVTLDHAATSGGGSIASYYGDVVTIDGVDFYAWISYGAVADNTILRAPWSLLALNRYVNCFSVGDTTLDYGYDKHWLATMNLVRWVEMNANLIAGGALSTTTIKAIGMLYAGPGGPPGGPTITSDYYRPGSAAIAFAVETALASVPRTNITATCSAPLGLVLVADPGNGSRPNRVYFSDADEPESVPLLNYIDIGALDEPIQALVPLRDALLVFKTDGIWRITGSAPSSWNVEQLDTRMRLVRPETVAVMNGVAYAWCDRGFFAIDEASCTSLSADAIDVELRKAFTATDFYLAHGAFVVAWRRRNLILLGASDGTGTTKLYAFSIVTNAWSEWDGSWCCAAESIDDAVYAALTPTPDGHVLYEVRKGGDTYGFDRTYAVGTVFSVTGATVVVHKSNVGQWVPTEGDFFGVNVGGTTYMRRVVSASFSSPYWTIVMESAIPGAGTGDQAWFAWVSYLIAIEWHPMTPGRVPTGAMVRELHVQMDLRDAPDPTLVSLPPRYDLGGSSELSPTKSLLTSNKARVASIQPLRAGVDRQIARGASIAPYLETRDAYALRVLGVSVVHEATSERTAR